MSAPRFTPFRDTVILTPVRPPVEEVTPGGIILPESTKEAEKNKPLSAIALYEVVAFGEGARKDSWRQPLAGGEGYRIDVGSKVWVKSYVVDSYDQAGSFVACKAEDIWAGVEDAG